MGGPEVDGGKALLNAINIPTYDYPDTAATAFNYMWKYTYNLRGLYETPTLAAESDPVAARPQEVRGIIDAARQTGRTILTEAESKQVLAAYNIPTVQTHVAAIRRRGGLLGRQIGLPGGLQVALLHADSQDRCGRREIESA